MEGLGDIDSNHETVGVWLANRDESTKELVERKQDSAYTRGIVYYLKDNVVVGVLLWNATDQMERAKEVLNQQKLVKSPVELRSAILLAPENWLDVIVAGQ